jgi:hypothetical protein
MTTKNDLPQDGQAEIDLAMQVANIATLVTAALRSGDSSARSELVGRLTVARDRLEQAVAPPGLVPFIDVMCGLLEDQDVSAREDELPGAYRAVYEQIVDEMQVEDDKGELTLQQVLDEVTHNLILAMKHGSHHQRRMMANTLLRMQHESVRRPDLPPLIEYLQAGQALLQEQDPRPFAQNLRGPFREKWDQVLEALRT